MSYEGGVDLAGIAVRAGERKGTIWSLGQSEDLNANLVRFTEGRGVEEHVNNEVDVVFLGVSGSGVVRVNGEEIPLGPGRLLFVPKGVRRATRSVSEDFAYLTVHRRRGPVRIGLR